MMGILVAVDGSGPSLDAVRHVLRLMREGLRARLVLATVQEPVYLYEMVLAPGADVLERLGGAVGASALEGAEALLAAEHVPYVREIGSGEPASALIDLSRRHGCSAIVVGARGLGAVRGALLGSVSRALLRDSPVPVTVVRGTEQVAPGSAGA